MDNEVTIKYAMLSNGATFFYQHWIPHSPKDLVVFVHGLGDHIGRYGNFACQLMQRNHAVALYDQRGHGRSYGRRGHIGRFQDWLDDLAGFINFSRKTVSHDTPVFLLGTSVGALIVIRYLIDMHSQASGAVTISAPIIRNIAPSHWKQKVIGKASRFAPWFPMKTSYETEALTSDADQLALIASDAHLHRRMTVRACVEIQRNAENILASAHRIFTPMLMLAGADDTMCDPRGSRFFADRLSSPRKYYRIYDSMRHDLLHDTNSASVIDDIDDWLCAIVEANPSAGTQCRLNGGGTAWENVSQY